MAISRHHGEYRGTTEEKGSSEQTAVQDQRQRKHGLSICKPTARQNSEKRGDERQVPESLVGEAEEAAIRGNRKELYNMNRALAGNNCRPERTIEDRSLK